MSSNFHVKFEKNNGNLHVCPSGDFDGSSAWELVNLLHEQYDGQGQVYIDTDNLTGLCPFGCSTFHCRLNRRLLPAERIIFKGKNGGDIAPRGSTVLDRHPKCRCGGDCANCRCNRSRKTH